MSQEEVIVNEFAQTTRDYWSSHSDYDTVNTLLLLWADDDLNVEPEVLKLQSLFQEDFKFTTRIYRIPSDNAAIELHYELVGFIKQHSLERRSLTIVYYAGHADNADNKSAAGYSEWRA
jgi:hypothetical protein